MCSAKDRYTLIEQSSNSRITCMQKNFMRIIGNDQKNGQNFWEIPVRIIGKISSIIGAGLIIMMRHYHSYIIVTSLCIVLAIILMCSLHCNAYHSTDNDNYENDN